MHFRRKKSSPRSQATSKIRYLCDASLRLQGTSQGGIHFFLLFAFPLRKITRRSSASANPGTRRALQERTRVCAVQASKPDLAQFLYSPLSSEFILCFIKMPVDNTINILGDLPTLRDIPLGDLYKIAVANRLEDKAAKEVLKERVEWLAKKAGLPAGFRTGACNGEHGTTVGVRPETAGVMWSYVSRVR